MERFEITRLLISAIARDIFTSGRKVSEDRCVIFIQSHPTSSAFPVRDAGERFRPTRRERFQFVTSNCIDCLAFFSRSRALRSPEIVTSGPSGTRAPGLDTPIDTIPDEHSKVVRAS